MIEDLEEPFYEEGKWRQLRDGEASARASDDIVACLFRRGGLIRNMPAQKRCIRLGQPSVNWSIGQTIKQWLCQYPLPSFTSSEIDPIP
jgi:hypothetical protein